MTGVELMLRARLDPPWSPGWAAVLAAYLSGAALYPEPFRNRDAR